MDFNKRRENAFGGLLAKKPESDRPSSHYFNTRISPGKSIYATSAYNPGKYVYGNNPVGFRLKEGQVVQKTQASRDVVFFCCLLV
jgi:hypothetical protein